MLRIVFYCSLCHIANGMDTWNHSKAEEKCKSSGGLISYRDMKINIRANRDNSTIYTLLSHDGQSAWISGYVKFSSKYVIWIGCYNGQDKAHIKFNTTLTENGIFTCLRHCSNSTDVMYIGLQGDSCYCLHDVNNAKALNDNECQPLQTEPDYLYGSHVPTKQNINVYLIATFHISSDASYFGQCVFARKYNDNIRYATQSCTEGENSYICVRSVNVEMNCNSYNGNLCIIENTTNWLQAADQCKTYSGKLISHIYENDKNRISTNISYWTAVIRSYELLNEQPTRKPYTCLAVTNVNDKLAFHPDNCSVQKMVICTNSVSSSSKDVESGNDVMATSSIYNNDTVKFTINSDNRENVEVKKRSNQNNYLTGIYIAVGAVFVIILAVFVLWLIRRKKHKSLREQVSDKIGDDIKADDYASIDINYGASNETKALDASQIPTPLEKTETSGEYSSISKLKSYPNKCDYDIVNFSNPGKERVLRPAELRVESSDIHIYGHHPNLDNASGDYDHLGAYKPKQITKSAGVYSAMTDVTGTYSELKTRVTNKPVVLSNMKRKPRDEDNSVYN